MSSSLLAERNLDVCLSFSGKIPHGIDFDNYLSQNGIKTFKSDSWKRKSFGVDQQIRKALAESKVVLFLMSEQTAYSLGFLEELIIILQFQKERSLIVIPLFFKIHHLDVEEISQHFFGPPQVLCPWRAPFWRKALTKLNNIVAQYALSTDRLGISGLDRLKNIADDIWLMLLSSASSNFKGLGIDRQMKAFHELLALDFVNDVRAIGIWGKAGVGKTALARYIYEKISVSFQTHVFLENVENMKDKFLS